MIDRTVAAFNRLAKDAGIDPFILAAGTFVLLWLVVTAIAITMASR